MGVTDHSLTLIQKALEIYRFKSVVELGAQNLYSKDYPHQTLAKGGHKFPYADEFYNELKIKYTCIDLNGENKALKIDLSKPHKVEKDQISDLVTDFGTSEHVSGKSGHSTRAFYNCLKTKHDLCKKGGIIISENPKTGHWPGHGCNYYTEQFYRDLQTSGAIEIVQLGEHPAMGNSTTGMNVYCIAKKVGNFPTFAQFKTFTFTDS